MTGHFHFPRRSTLIHLTAMITVVLALFIARNDTPPARAEVLNSSNLLVSTRDRFRICLVQSEGTNAQAVRQKLGRALLQIQQQHSMWASAVGTNAPSVEAGCQVNLPAQALGRGSRIGPGLTEAPSPYRTVVVVLDHTQGQNVLADNNAMLVPYELMQVDDHTAVTVTTAVVVKEEALGDPEFTDWYLSLAMGLKPEQERSSPEEDPNAKKP